MLEPLNKFVLIRLDKEQEKTKGGIILQEKQQKQDRGTVVGISDNEEVKVKVHDRVLFIPVNCVKTEDDAGNEFLVVPYQNIVCRMRGETAKCILRVCQKKNEKH